MRRVEAAVRIILGLFVFVFLGLPAAACGPEVRIQFIEESPDRFRIEFVRGPKLELRTLTINLTGSAAGAIYDDYDGINMQGPQPNVHGVTIRSIEYRTAKDETVSLTFSGFAEKKGVTFHSDLDDNGQGADPDQNHIVDGELKGASATATLVSDDGKTVEVNGQFDEKSRATLGERACV